MKKFLLGYTTGVFDLFHIGHLNLLKGASEQCETLVVGVSTDELVYSYKAKYPVIPFIERIEIVKSIKFVDQVIPQVSMNKVSAREHIEFDVMFVGSDWKGSSKWIDTETQLAQLGVQVVYLPYTQSTSSTLLRSVLTKMTARDQS
jgi:glycerol-3-phosphate cytidylyltransferase